MTLIAKSQSKLFARRAARATLCAAVVVLLGLPGGAGAAEPGVVLPNPGDQATQAQIAASGARNVRVFASWRMLESQRGQFTPYILAGYDALANRMKAAGIPVYFVVTQTPSWATASQAPNAPPPADAYADFVRRLAAHFRGRVSAYELWNEPDEAFSWEGGATPAQYAALLKPAYAAAKSADPGARVGVGGLVANHFAFVEGLYAAGAKGSFDFVSVHTDTACNRADPRVAGRDENGRISRWSFTGYREVRASMLDHGDDKPIWMTELGWSVTGQACPHGGPGAGVSPGQQAAFLTRAYACLAADPYVEKASWFSLADLGAADQVGLRYGLYDWRGRSRPALAAFKQAGRVRPNRSCGKRVDRGGAAITLVRPTDNRNVSRYLNFKATARDGSGVLTLHLLVDGKQIRVTSKRWLQGRLSSAWRRLPYGPHKVTFKAVDRAHNVTTKSVTVNRVPDGAGERIRTRIAAAVYGSGRRRIAAGTLYTQPSSARSSLRGRINISLERKSGSRWRPVGQARAASVPGPVKVARKLKPGRYRAVFRFAGYKSFGPSVARRTFTVS